MTKIADFSSFTPEQLDELRDIFTRFEFIVGSLRKFQEGLYDLNYDYAVPFVSVLELFSDSWHQNCLLFNRFLPSSDYFLEEIYSHIQAIFSVFVASETAVFSCKGVVPPGSSSYALLLQCVFYRCDSLLSSARKKLKQNGIRLEVK